MSLPKIRDLIYFDIEKASSIWSQFQWGLLERISISEDASTNQEASATIGVPNLVQAALGIEGAEKRSILETRILHHDLLNRVEALLSASGLVLDLSAAVSKDESSPEIIRSAIGGRPYIKAEGWSVIEDYRRILSISEKFNELIGFIKESQSQAIKANPAYVQLQASIDSARREASQLKDHNARAVAKSRVKALEDELSKLLVTQLSTVDQWIIDGLKLWINTFMPNRINFRIYPFVNCPAFQVLCNLKRECFVDQDLEHLLYGYGNRPNVRLTAFGLITSIPPESDDVFNPMAEFDAQSDLPSHVQFEKAIRGIFAAMDGIEALVRYSRYPNVTIHPIAVFRDFVAAGTT